jgi:hypothetical protein
LLGERERMKRIAIVNVNLEYEIPKNIKNDDVEEYLQNVELPKEYVTDSFEFVKVMKN